MVAAIEGFLAAVGARGPEAAKELQRAEAQAAAAAAAASDSLQGPHGRHKPTARDLGPLAEPASRLVNAAPPVHLNTGSGVPTHIRSNETDGTPMTASPGLADTGSVGRFPSAGNQSQTHAPTSPGRGEPRDSTTPTSPLLRAHSSRQSEGLGHVDTGKGMFPSASRPTGDGFSDRASHGSDEEDEDDDEDELQQAPGRAAPGIPRPGVLARSQSEGVRPQVTGLATSGAEGAGQGQTNAGDSAIDGSKVKAKVLGAQRLDEGGAIYHAESAPAAKG